MLHRSVNDEKLITSTFDNEWKMGYFHLFRKENLFVRSIRKIYHLRLDISKLSKFQIINKIKFMLLFVPFLSFLSKQHRIELSRVLKTINNSQFQCVNWNSAKRRNCRRFPIKPVEVKSIRVKQTFSFHSPNHTPSKKNIYIHLLKVEKKNLA